MSIALRTTTGSCLLIQYRLRAASARTETTQQSNSPAGTVTRSSAITESRAGTTALLAAVTDTTDAESSHVGRSGSTRSTDSSMAELTIEPVGTTPTIERRPVGALVAPYTVSARNSAPRRAFPSIADQCIGRSAGSVYSESTKDVAPESDIRVSSSNQAGVPAYVASDALIVLVPMGVAAASRSRVIW